MIGWVLAAIEAPLFVLICCAVSTWQRRQNPAAQRESDCSVAAIAARIEQERAGEAAAWPQKIERNLKVLTAFQADMKHDNVAPAACP